MPRVSCPLGDLVTFLVRKGPDDYHDEIDQDPYSQPAECDEHEYPGSDFPDEESMHAEPAKEETQQKHRQNLLLTHCLDSFRSTTPQPRYTRLRRTNHPTKHTGEMLDRLTL